jgi:hypothetical protein
MGPDDESREAECMTMGPDVDTSLAIFWWSVISAAVIVTVYAAIVVILDCFRRPWDGDPRRTEIRERLEQLGNGHKKPATRVDETRVTDITTRRVGGA